MKKTLNAIFILFFALIIFYGCEDRSDLVAPPDLTPVSGDANLSKYVAIGNSLTAGYQSSALYQSAQQYSYPNLIAQQVGLTSFAQPLISDPGIGGQIKIVSLEPFVTKYEQSSGTPINLSYPALYGNLGIPGAVLYDVMNATNSTDCGQALSGGGSNPFFDIVLRNSTLNLGSQFKQAKILHPTFITLWIGNNDVLGFATSGGAKPTAPTPSATFAYLFSQLADSLASTGAKVVVANIPSVTAIPFFTTVGPGFGLQLKALSVPAFYYQSGQYVPTIGTPDQLINKTILLTLISQTYLADFGKPSGRFYRDKGIPPAAVGADTTQPLGSQGNPIPNALVLDAAEINIAAQSTNDFNSTISAVASAKGWGLVNINSIFNAIRVNDATGGTDFGGISFKTTFVTGGLFSLDGVHPTAQGQAILANEFLKVINSKFGASYPLIDVGTIPGSLGLAKSLANKVVLPDYNYSMLKNLCF